MKILHGFSGVSDEFKGAIATIGNFDGVHLGHQQIFRKIVQGVNDTLDAVVGPLHVAAHYIERLANGDLPDTITEEYKGDFSILIFQKGVEDYGIGT